MFCARVRKSVVIYYYMVVLEISGLVFCSMEDNRTLVQEMMFEPKTLLDLETALETFSLRKCVWVGGDGDSDLL
jgi:hypothetical protein